MSAKFQFVSQSYESFRDSLSKAFSAKVLVSCCPESLYYFNQNLLTPAEFLNSVEIPPVRFNLNLRDEQFFQQSCSLSLKFVDLEEFDNYSRKYFRGNLLCAVIENSPSEELLEKLETVRLLGSVHRRV